MVSSGAGRSVTALTALLAVLVTGACATDGQRGGRTAAGRTVIQPVGCPDPTGPTRDEGPDGTPVAEAQPRERTKTVAHHVAGIDVDIPRALRGIRGLGAHSGPIAAHTLPSSGLRVEVHSDGALDIDPTALDEAFAAPFDLEAFGDRQLRSVMACYRDRILTGRELEGTRVRLLVPSDPTTCLHRTVTGAEAPPGAPCRSGGVTLPEVDVSFGGFVRLAGSPLIILAPAAVDRDPAQPGRALTRLLFHELVHLYDNAMGLFPSPGQLMAYEQRAEYVERALVNHHRRQERDLPQPIRFVDTAPPEGS